MNIVESIERSALLHAGRIAVQTATRAVSYEELVDRVRRADAALRAAGLQRGEAVVAAGEGLDTLVLQLAAARAGGAALVEAAAGRAPAAAWSPAAPRLWVGDFTGFAASAPAQAVRLSHEALQAAPASTEPPVACEPQDPWSLVASTVGGMPGSVVPRAHGLSLTAMALSAAVIRYAPGDRLLLGAAPGGSFGSTHWVQALAAGATVVLPASRDAAVVVQALHATSATHFVSTTLEALSLVRAAGTQSRPESLRWACLAGAMLDPLLIGALRERFTPNLQLHFGTAESGIVAQADAALAAQQPGCAGRLLPWAEAYAAGRGGERLPTGAVGRLCLRSAVAAGAYFGEGAEGARVFPGRGWFASTFAATVTPGGLVHLCTQDAPTVKLGEVVLDATVLERAIRRLPAVRDAGVVALPVAGGLPELVAVVVAADQGSLEGLALHCALQVGRAAVPRRVVLAASLPRAADGRLDRTALQRLAAEGTPAGAPPGTLLS